MHTIKRFLMLALVTFGALGAMADLDTNTITVIWTRGEDSAAIPGVYSSHSPLIINGRSRVAAGVGTNAATMQDLTGLGGYVVMGGLAATNAPYLVFPISVVSATGGTFTVALDIPVFTNFTAGAAGYGSASLQCPLQLALTNSAGRSYVYVGIKQLTVVKPIGPE